MTAAQPSSSSATLHDTDYIQWLAFCRRAIALFSELHSPMTSPQSCSLSRSWPTTEKLRHEAIATTSLRRCGSERELSSP
ncbi:MAG: hypothetical protein ACFB5Z_17065 [Elainellaceae cyanobacterium]